MATDLPKGSLQQRLARCEPTRSDATACPDALEAQRLVLAAVSADQEPLPGVVREPTQIDTTGATNEDAAVPASRPNPISSSAAPLIAQPERSSGSLAAASSTVFPDEELVHFTPVRTLHRVASVALLVGLAATAITAYAAWRTRAPNDIAVAAAAGLVTLLVARIRGGATVARVSIAPGGRLEIARGDARTVFDLGSGYAPVDELGEPTERSWRVLIQRRGMRPYVVDRTLVRPREFSPILRRYVPRVTQ